MTSDNKFRAANVKIVIDDSALYRQQQLSTMQDLSQMDPVERIASFNELKYRTIHKEGSIGLISNGAASCLGMIDLID